MLKASIIAAFYNRIDYLKLVLAGFERQTEKDFELIIADDGSTQEVATEIEKQSSSYNYSIVHLWQEDKGFRKNKIFCHDPWTSNVSPNSNGVDLRLSGSVDPARLMPSTVRWYIDPNRVSAIVFPSIEERGGSTISAIPASSVMRFCSSASAG